MCVTRLRWTNKYLSAMTNDEDLREFLKTAIFLILMWACLCIFLSFFAACRSTRHVENHSQERDSMAMVVNNIQFDRKWFEQMKTDSSWKNDYWQMRIYDTSKPIDAMTNLPPVLADVSHKKETGSKHEENVTQTDTSATQTHTDIVQTHEEVNDEQTDEETGDRGVPRWKLWLAGGIFAAIMLMIAAGRNKVYDITTTVLNKIFG